MCGFVAIVDTNRKVEPDLLTEMRDALVHRGPDEKGMWVADDRAIGFGTRRLKIIDLVSGQQPMATPDGATVLAYNGELYNHVSLRSQLENQGYRFHTRCDTEVVLATYQRLGDKCLERFNGMFALAVWDAQQQRLFFARDRAGEKPLYYAQTRTGLAFASEIKALLRHPDISRAVDTEALDYYLSFLTTPPPSTLFSGISKLPAAHCGSWSEREGLKTWRWWDLPAREEGLAPSQADAADELKNLFHTSVEQRMMSDVPIGVYLSGGVDSSANVAFMCQHSRDRLHTFSVAFAHEPRVNELAPARHVASFFGTEHREIVLDDDDVIGSLPEIIHHQDEPLADPVCVPLFHLARLTKGSGVTVVQIGEGSDESFFGYPIYTQVFRAARALRSTRLMLPRLAIAAGIGAIGSVVGEHRREFMLEALWRGIPPPHGVAGLSEAHKDRILVNRNGQSSAYRYLTSVFGSARSDSEIASVGLTHEFGLRLPELLLMRIDKMTMSASVEARAPFLDHHLIEFAARLPLSLHWAKGGGKRILKRAFTGVVPEDVLMRPKQGFEPPVWRWLSPLQPLAERQILREPMFDHFKEDALIQLLSGPQTRRRGAEFWVLLNFALWHRHWIEGEDLREVDSFTGNQSSSPAVGRDAS
jgi:asparagine synthase (glutamine-hydrolysing)